jgi:hypothetical protein
MWHVPPNALVLLIWRDFDGNIYQTFKRRPALTATPPLSCSFGISAMPCEATTVEDLPCLSLNEEAWLEACIEAWIRSEEAGTDVGEMAIRQWIHKHWPGFLRARWMEHLLGIRRWTELRSDDFGLLKKVPQHQHHLLNPIVDRLLSGWENLNFATWCVRECSLPETDDILDLVARIDINSGRMRCDFENKFPSRSPNN